MFGDLGYQIIVGIVQNVPQTNHEQYGPGDLEYYHPGTFHCHWGT